MAKLPINKFHFTADNGEVLEFTSETNVSIDGEFYLNIPLELKDSAQEILKAARDAYPRTYIGFRQRSTKLWVSGPNLELCKKLIAVVAKDYLKCEVITERVIIYGTEITLAVWKDNKGNYHPNGCQGKPGQWVKGYDGEFTIHATNRTDFYKIGLAAMVADKLTYIRKSGHKIVYKPIKDPMAVEIYLDKLNSFCGLNIRLPGEGTMKEMPYTEQAAKFFYEAMIGLCAMADKLSIFLNDKEKLELAIEKQSSLLLLN